MPISFSQISGAFDLRRFAFGHARRATLISSTILTGLASSAHAGAPLPVGGSVAQGVATISGNTNSTTVTQSSSRAVINWQSFDVAAGKSVVFNQPNAQSATLNRVTGDTNSTIAGQITSNGAVYLINPNGIAITSTGSVNTAGGFVASTLDIADADFMAGNLKFAGSGASGTVTNAGHVAAGQGAYVALLGGAVSNSGTINVPYGKVGLGSGESIALDLNGNGFMQVAVPSALLTGSNALIDNAGSIFASGGTVQLQAAVVRDAIRNVINMSGSINADSATGDGGTIHLIGGADTANMAGTVTVNGTLSAQATGASGNGGNIETSGASVNFAGAKVDTTAKNGKTGSWLLDPTDLTIDATAAGMINTALATSNVTLQTTATGSPTGPVGSTGNTTGSGLGDINVNSALTWTSNNTLSLLAYNNISLNAAITAQSGSLILTAGNGVANTGTISDTAALSIGTFNLTNGAWAQNSAILPAFAAIDFRFNPTTATFLRAVGGDGTSGNAYQVSDIYGLQGLASSTFLQGKYFGLANNIDASGTVNWNSGAGFVSIGTDGKGNVWDESHAFTATPTNQFTNFSGFVGFASKFTGNGYAINGLMINRPTQSYTGLFGYDIGGITNVSVTNARVAGASDTGILAGEVAYSGVSNIFASGTVSSPGGELVGGLVGALLSNSGVIGSHAAVDVTGGAFVGGLVGGTSDSVAYGHFLGAGGIISNSYATGNVTGFQDVGGLVGYGNVVGSYATGAISGGSSIGGLVGNGTARESYATGAVTGGTNVGGLIGTSNGTVIDVYATGSVSSNAPGYFYGGLIGNISIGTVSNAYASGSVTGPSLTGGLIGNIGAGTVVNSYWDSYSTGQSVAIGNATAPASVSAVTSDPAQSAAANYAYNISAYANFAAASGIGTASPTGFVFAPGNSTRPFLAFEVPSAATSGTDASGNILINNSHQLQLIGYDGTTLPASYALANGIDLAETGAVVAGTPGSYSGMWSGAGFVPLGTDGAGNIWSGTAFTSAGVTGFSGNLNGQGFAISNLTVNRPTVSYQGLFGALSGSISNLGLTNVNVKGGSTTGGLVGYQASGTISNSYSLGTVSGVIYTGGLVGNLNGGSITNSYSSASVSSTSYSVGGLIGNVGPGGSVTSSYATGNVSSTVSGTNAQVGGLIGLYASASTLSNVYATGNVSSGGQYTGGLIGQMTAGTLTNGTASGAVSGTNYVGGLIGYDFGAGLISNSSATGNVTATGTYVGGLIGDLQTSSVSNSTASGTVKGSGRVGGLVGFATGASNITASSASGAVTSTGSFAGGLVGYSLSSGTISTSFATGSVTGTLDVGGLIGVTNNTVKVNTSYATGNVTGIGANVGGLIGLVGSSGLIDSVYATGNVTDIGTSASGVGGLIGYHSAGTISNAYATGSVTGATTTTNVGGFVGVQLAGNVTNFYATGFITGGATGSTHSLIGGYNNGTISTGYYDTYSSGLNGASTPVSGNIMNINAVSSDPLASGTAGYAFDGSSYTALPSSKWTLVPGARPILAFQSAAALTPVNGVVTLSTVAQLATLNASATTLGQSYTLGGNVNLGATSIIGTPGSFSGVFANGVSFTPIGTDGAGNILNGGAGFSGTFNGGGFTISGLNISTSANYAGLFGYSTGAISNLIVLGTVASTGKFVGGVVGYQLGGGITNVISYVNVSGFAAVGGIAGSARGINLTNSSSSGTISGTNEVGGIAGEQVGGVWTGVTSTASVTGTGAFTGGLVGVMYGGSLSGSASGTVSGALDVGGLVGYEQSTGSSISASTTSGTTVSGTSNVGGLVGYAEGSITGSSSSYLVSGTSDLGGLVGRQAGGAITNASATGSVTGGDVAGSHFLGGLIGYQDAGGSVTNSSSTGNVSSSLSTGTAYYIGGLIGDAHGSITGSSASGNVGGSNTDYAGGLVGLQAGASISTSKASGTVTGQLATGGLVGYTVSGSIDQAYASGAVTGGNGAVSYAGGLIGFLNAGTITNVYATGAVGGTAKYAGGLLGYQYGGSIAQAYATGNISSSLATGSVKLGGLIGYQQAGSLTNGLWDTQTTGMASGYGYQKSGATFSGTGLTTLQLQDFANYATTYPGFDFTTLWAAPNQAGQNSQTTAAYPTLTNRP